MKRTKIRAIIIDFDDTLYLSEQACFELENTVLGKMGRAKMSRAIHKQTWGMQIREAIKVRSPGIDVAEYEKLATPTHQEFVQTGKIDVVTDENLQVLDGLAESGYQLFIVTSRTKSEAMHFLDPRHHFGSRFAHIYHADNTTHIKPDPRVFDSLLSDYDLTPKECVYIGDSPTDGIAANKANIKFIATFESGLKTEADFSDVRIDASINRFTDLPKALEAI